MGLRRSTGAKSSWDFQTFMGSNLFQLVCICHRAMFSSVFQNFLQLMKLCNVALLTFIVESPIAFSYSRSSILVSRPRPIVTRSIYSVSMCFHCDLRKTLSFLKMLDGFGCICNNVCPLMF